MRGMLGNLQISFISAILMHGVLMAMIGKCGFHFVIVVSRFISLILHMVSQLESMYE